MQNLNIRLGLVQKYIPFWTSPPEFAKYAANMKGPDRIMRIPRVWRGVPIEMSRPMQDTWEARSSYNFPQKRGLVKQNPSHLTVRHWFLQSELDLSQIYGFCCSRARFSGAIFIASLMRTKQCIFSEQDEGFAKVRVTLGFWVGKYRHFATSMHFCNFRLSPRAKYR